MLCVMGACVASSRRRRSTGRRFSPVDRVLQVGSPRGLPDCCNVRSQRSRPVLSAASRGPTNALELIDVAAAAQRHRRQRLEARRPVERPLTCSQQHLVTVALGGGFCASELPPRYAPRVHTQVPVTTSGLGARLCVARRGAYAHTRSTTASST